MKRVAKQKIYEKKVKMSNLLAIEVDFTFTQIQRPKNSKKKDKKFKMAAKFPRLQLSFCFCCLYAYYNELASERHIKRKTKEQTLNPLCFFCK